MKNGKKLSLEARARLAAMPCMAGFALFFVLPFLGAIRYSFLENTYTLRFVGLDNYIKVFNNRYFRLALKNTFLFILTQTPLLMLLSLTLALFSQRVNRLWLRSALVLPVLLPSAAIVPILRTLLGASLLKTAPLLPLHLLFQWKNVGFHLMILLSGLRMIPEEVYEAASLDGAGGLRKLLSITLPLLKPTLFFSLVLMLMQALKIFKEAYLLYGAYPANEVYMVQHYMNNHFYKLNYQTLTAAACLFAIALYAIVALLWRYESQENAL